jgi:hypothetical protein
MDKCIGVTPSLLSKQIKRLGMNTVCALLQDSCVFRHVSSQYFAKSRWYIDEVCSWTCAGWKDRVDVSSRNSRKINSSDFLKT